MKNICILGSTGSIGTQTLEVIDNLNDIRVLCLSTNKNICLLEEQILKYNPLLATVMDEESFLLLKEKMKNHNVKILHGMDGLLEMVSLKKVETVINSLVGNVGLLPTMQAIEEGKHIALANKETLVTSGEIVMRKIKEKNVSLYPIDSEHSAIFQCLVGNENNKVEKIYLTASGGPFRSKTFKELENITVKEALAHPNWVMGQKITIDSATLMNKGLEVIEAKWLFDLDISQIEVLVHPQSIIHSMVLYEDGACMAQLGESDMRIPIQYAMTYPERRKSNFNKLDFLKKNNLTFEPPNMEYFKCLGLAFKALEIGGTMPTVLNGANEVAVSLFLEEKISFLQIPKLIENAMNEHTVIYDINIEDIISADNWVRKFATDSFSNLKIRN